MQSPLEIKFHPLDLSEHGVTSGGLPLYRVVWAKSRITKLLYEGKVIELPMYDEMPLTYGKWILEKWLSPMKYVGMTRDQWEAMFAAGPMFGAPKQEYPVDGEYELAHIFTGTVSAAEAREGIAKTESDLRNLSPEELKKLRLQREEKKRTAQKAEKAKVMAEIIDTPKEKVGVVYG